MHSPAVPHGGALAEHPPREGPDCFCNQPTMLQVLNGRNVYVCHKYPNHHCRACCPADTMLLGQSAKVSSNALLQPFGSPLSPMMSQDEASASPDDSTTPSNNILSNGKTPAAPSKRTFSTSGTSRTSDSGAVRSLTPLFNGCAAAASRAQQLGGRFVRYRPQAQSVAKMQRQMSGSSSQERSPTTAAAATMPGSVSRKRVREERPSPRTVTFAATPFGLYKKNTASGSRQALSVQTVSRGPEVRKAWNGNLSRGGLHTSQQQQQQQQQ